MLEYASIRFVFVCARATMFPPVIVRAASTASIALQSTLSGPSAPTMTRKIAANAAAGADRHECCGRSWRAVVRVRGPLVERDDRGLEPETDGDERQGDDRRAVRDALRGENAGDRHEVGRVGDAVEPREAIEEQGRAERPQKEILEGGLVGETV